ncbi:MAG TPA: hypothetical protein PLV51_00270 [Lentimicrobium sp.]|jgi:hypothetical protein|nr:hypothetical protein [Lentimicrobium sp.]
MNLRKTGVITLLAAAFALLAVSCSTPAYKQNKYKRAKRFNDCGCMQKPTDASKVLSYNEQK